MLDNFDNRQRDPHHRSRLVFKVATQDWEFGLIHRLNHRTFVDEIPQHRGSQDGLLVDRFHGENTYFICLDGNNLLGMVSVRAERPFSLDQKLDNLDRYLPEGVSVCEIRLLAIEKERRKGRIIQGLLTRLARYCIDKGFGAAIISGNVRQEKLYRRMGFKAFGPRLGTPEATYQPMILALRDLEKDWSGYLSRNQADQPFGKLINLLPGPVTVSPEVQRVFSGPPGSHRAPEFVAYVKTVKDRLCEVASARGVEILMGSGTLANDAIAAQLTLSGGKGLVLSNGEFGDRLLDHASRARLDFDCLQVKWGSPFRRRDVERALDTADARWLWAVHSETSTGVLNDLSMLASLCDARGVRLAMDCISSIGTVPVDLSGVSLASCVSGKGLGAYPGLAMVFYDPELLPLPGKLPRYLDLGFYAARDGVPFTLSTNLLYALGVAVRDLSQETFDRTLNAAVRLRRELRSMGYAIVAADRYSTPAVTTIALPPDKESFDVGRRLEGEGFLLSYNSEYLRNRNWIQVCLMGSFAMEGITDLPAVLSRLVPIACWPVTESGQRSGGCLTTQHVGSAEPG